MTVLTGAAARQSEFSMSPRVLPACYVFSGVRPSSGAARFERERDLVKFPRI